MFQEVPLYNEFVIMLQLFFYSHSHYIANVYSFKNI